MIAVSECKCATNGTLADNNHIAFEVNRLHTSIGEGTKQIIAYAIKIGELLDIVKINLEKNDFEIWVKENIPFATRTAYRYISLFNHKNQIAAAESLQEAYRQIETLEAQKRQTETQRAFNRVAEFRKTGVKPEGWRRGTDDKLAKEEQERDARIDQVKREALSREEKKQEQEQQREQQKVETENLLNFLDQNIQVEKKRTEFKEKIRVSANGMNDPFQDAIMDYLEGLENDSRRIEACHNIIKVCKRIAAELQGAWK